jgi:hypothetical protein
MQDVEFHNILLVSNYYGKQTFKEQTSNSRVTREKRTQKSLQSLKERSNLKHTRIE